MTTYIKLPNNWFVSVPATLLAEYAILQMYLDRDGFVSSVQGLGPLSTFVEWLSSSSGFNAGHLGFAIGIHVFEGIFAFKLARDKNLNLMSCIFWFVQTLIIGVGSFEVLCEYEAPPNPKKQDYFKSPGVGWWIFLFGFWFVVGGSAYSADNSIFASINGIPGISDVVNWYTNATSYATQCLIFGATVGVHTAESMFVKHMAFMKGVFSESQRWMWWFQTLWFGLPSTKLMVNYHPKGKQN